MRLLRDIGSYVILVGAIVAVFLYWVAFISLTLRTARVFGWL